MNNRMLARIVAAVMAIAMLGSISFAASISGDVINVGAPSDAAYTGQAQKTAIAYFADTADETDPADNDIIAIYQADGVPGEIKIDTAKATDLTGSNRKYLVVKCGGSDGANTAQTFAIDLSNETDVDVADTYTIDYGTWEKVFENVAAFTQTITLEAGQTVESYGFKLWQQEGGTYTSENKPLYFTSDTVIEGEGDYSFGIVMVATDGASLAGKSFYTIK